jgi:hypothetical protein
MRKNKKGLNPKIKIERRECTRRIFLSGGTTGKTDKYRPSLSMNVKEI